HRPSAERRRQRQDGGLELLLTTPLSGRAMVDGQHRALWVQFGGLFGLVVVLAFVLCVGGFVSVGGFNPVKSASYFMLWVLLTWFWTGAHRKAVFRSMWIATWTGRTGYAALQCGLPFAWPFVVVCALLWSGMFREFPLGHPMELILMILVIPI